VTIVVPSEPDPLDEPVPNIPELEPVPTDPLDEPPLELFGELDEETWDEASPGPSPPSPGVRTIAPPQELPPKALTRPANPTNGTIPSPRRRTSRALMRTPDQSSYHELCGGFSAGC